MQIDTLITDALFSDSETQKIATDNIYTLASKKNIYSASLFSLYREIGDQKISNSFTVPAINIRTLTYDTARIIFRLMKKHMIGPIIFEIAKSEMVYTDQPPQEYATAVLAAAVAEDHTGPVFIQGDHFQLNKEHFERNRDEELKSIELLIKKALVARFFNIDIDASTLVDLSKGNANDQQFTNSEVTAHFTSFIRTLQPEDTTVAIGGEIGHIGGVNSTEADFVAFMEGYLPRISEKGISKVSVQTGSSHGGTPLPDGTIKQIGIDFSVLQTIGKLARGKYRLGGAVQHGASTLPIDLFSEFPKKNAVEIHLATGFQNTVYDNMPTLLRDTMYEYVKEHFQTERKPGMTEQQFIYSLRKKALGPFKKTLFSLRREEKGPILNALEAQLEIIFEKLQLFNTKKILNEIY